MMQEVHNLSIPYRNRLRLKYLFSQIGVSFVLYLRVKGSSIAMSEGADRPALARRSTTCPSRIETGYV